MAIASPRRGVVQPTRDEARLLDQTLDLANELRTRFRLRNQLFSLIDATIFQDTYVEIPEAFRKTALEMRNPLALDIVDTTVSALCANAPTVQYHPTAFGMPRSRMPRCESTSSMRAGTARSRILADPCCVRSCGQRWPKAKA